MRYTCFIILLFFSVLLHAAPENTYANLSGPAVPREYVLFESDPVRPVALSHNGDFLFVANIPDSHVEVFAITPFGLSFYQSLPVGLEPVALAVSKDDKELWVVNHLSDSVSIIDISTYPFYTKQTLLVGDEPRDIVFAGSSENKAFITAAHRGQNLISDPQLYSPGVARADVWVFEQDSQQQARLINVVSLFGDTPRALAVSNDKSSVYAAVFKSGSRTTTLPPASINQTPKPPPLISADGITQPESGLIVKFNGIHWVDELQRSYDNKVSLNLPDYDAFEIDANAPQPSEINKITSVGTVLFNMAVHPQSGDILVSNLESRNHIRFEGKPLSNRTTVRGHLANNQISIIESSSITKIHLNKHLDFNKESGDENDRRLSLSLPMQMVFNEDGSELFLVAFGSNKIARYNYQDFKSNAFQTQENQQLEISGGAPAGLAIDNKYNRLYVYSRYDNGISTVDLNTFTESNHINLPNPEPKSIVEGRPFMYDATKTSGFGNDSCASCHVFANNDGLAWDLGNPDGSVQPIPNSYHPATITSPFLSRQFHPMKGPMTTQSMRGLVRHGPQHWRGDRTGTQPQQGESLEEAAFKEFNLAFDALLAKPEGLSNADMQKFTDFAMQLTYPPNPNRNIDNSLTDEQQAGKDMYDFGVLRANGNLEVCAVCHPIDPAMGIYGTTGQMTDNSQPGERDFKIPHFRDQYQKIGMFTSVPGFKQDQIRGFAFNHNGATSNNALFSEFGISSDKVRQLKSFLYAFPTETPPVVGQQVTIDRNTYSENAERINTLILRAQVNFPVPECDLTAFQYNQKQRQWMYDRQQQLFLEDDNQSSFTAEQFDSFLANAVRPVTLTCQPWGSGERIALDRDRDGIFNQQEISQGSDDSDSASINFSPVAGLWYNPQQPGSGFDFEVSGTNLAVIWYTFNEDKTPVWYLASAEINNHWSAELMKFEWNPNTSTAMGEVAGQIQISFDNAREGTINWTIDSNSGEINVEHYQFAETPASLKFTGLWYDSQEPGWGLSVISEGESRVVVSYFYDSENQPSWSIASMENSLTSDTPTLSVSGSCPWCEYTSPQHVENGNISFTFSSLNSASIQLIQYDSENTQIPAWQRQVENLSRLTNIYE